VSFRNGSENCPAILLRPEAIGSGPGISDLWSVFSVARRAIAARAHMFPTLRKKYALVLFLLRRFDMHQYFMNIVKL
jgi:hypothetical protein